MTNYRANIQSSVNSFVDVTRSEIFIVKPCGTINKIENSSFEAPEYYTDGTLRQYNWSYTPDTTSYRAYPITFHHAYSGSFAWKARMTTTDQYISYGTTRGIQRTSKDNYHDILSFYCYCVEDGPTYSLNNQNELYVPTIQSRSVDFILEVYGMTTQLYSDAIISGSPLYTKTFTLESIPKNKPGDVDNGISGSGNPYFYPWTRVTLSIPKYVLTDEYPYFYFSIKRVTNNPYSLVAANGTIETHTNNKNVDGVNTEFTPRDIGFKIFTTDDDEIGTIDNYVDFHKIKLVDNALVELPAGSSFKFQYPSFDTYFIIDAVQCEEQPTNRNATMYFDGSYEGFNTVRYPEDFQFTGEPYKSTSVRSPFTRVSGEIIDMNDYCNFYTKSIDGLSTPSTNTVVHTKTLRDGQHFVEQIIQNQDFVISGRIVADTHESFMDSFNKFQELLGKKPFSDPEPLRIFLRLQFTTGKTLLPVYFDAVYDSGLEMDTKNIFQADVDISFKMISTHIQYQNDSATNMFNDSPLHDQFNTMNTNAIRDISGLVYYNNVTKKWESPGGIGFLKMTDTTYTSLIPYNAGNGGTKQQQYDTKTYYTVGDVYTVKEDKNGIVWIGGRFDVVEYDAYYIDNYNQRNDVKLQVRCNNIVGIRNRKMVTNGIFYPNLFVDQFASYANGQNSQVYDVISEWEIITLVDAPTRYSQSNEMSPTAFVGLPGTYRNVSPGTITVNVLNNTVTGVGTNFAQSDVGSKLYNTSNVLIGTISSVTSSTSATLITNSALTLSAQSYILINSNTVYSIEFTPNGNMYIGGSFNVTYGGRTLINFCSFKAFGVDAQNVSIYKPNLFTQTLYNFVTTNYTDDQLKTIQGNGVYRTNWINSAVPYAKYGTFDEEGQVGDVGHSCRAIIYDYANECLYLGGDFIAVRNPEDVTNSIIAYRIARYDHVKQTFTGYWGVGGLNPTLTTYSAVNIVYGMELTYLANATRLHIVGRWAAASSVGAGYNVAGKFVNTRGFAVAVIAYNSPTAEWSYQETSGAGTDTTNFYDIHITKDQRIYVAGDFTELNSIIGQTKISGMAEFRYGRFLDITRGLEANFYPDGSTSFPIVQSIDEDNNGNIYLVGQFSNVLNKLNVDGVARWDGKNYSGVGIYFQPAISKMLQKVYVDTSDNVFLFTGPNANRTTICRTFQSDIYTFGYIGVDAYWKDLGYSDLKTKFLANKLDFEFLNITINSTTGLISYAPGIVNTSVRVSNVYDVEDRYYASEETTFIGGKFTHLRIGDSYFRCNNLVALRYDENQHPFPYQVLVFSNAGSTSSATPLPLMYDDMIGFSKTNAMIGVNCDSNITNGQVYSIDVTIDVHDDTKYVPSKLFVGGRFEFEAVSQNGVSDAYGTNLIKNLFVIELQKTASLHDIEFNTPLNDEKNISVPYVNYANYVYVGQVGETSGAARNNAVFKVIRSQFAFPSTNYREDPGFLFVGGDFVQSKDLLANGTLRVNPLLTRRLAILPYSISFMSSQYRLLCIDGTTTVAGTGPGVQTGTATYSTDIYVKAFAYMPWSSTGVPFSTDIRLIIGGRFTNYGTSSTTINNNGVGIWNILNFVVNYSLIPEALRAAQPGTISVSTLNTTVTGVGTSFSAADIGGKLYTTSNIYLGTIASVTSGISATLTTNSTQTLTSQQYILVSPSYPTGTISVSTANTTVTGIGTNFSGSDIGSKLYTTSNIYLGTIASVTSSTSATLTANSTQTLTSQQYTLASLLYINNILTPNSVAGAAIVNDISSDSLTSMWFAGDFNTSGNTQNIATLVPDISGYAYFYNVPSSTVTASTPYPGPNYFSDTIEQIYNGDVGVSFGVKNVKYHYYSDAVVFGGATSGVPSNLFPDTTFVYYNAFYFYGAKYYSQFFVPLNYAYAAPNYVQADYNLGTSLIEQPSRVLMQEPSTDVGAPFELRTSSQANANGDMVIPYQNAKNTLYNAAVLQEFNCYNTGSTSVYPTITLFCPYKSTPNTVTYYQVINNVTTNQTIYLALTMSANEVIRIRTERERISVISNQRGDITNAIINSRNIAQNSSNDSQIFRLIPGKNVITYGPSFPMQRFFYEVDISKITYNYNMNVIVPPIILSLSWSIGFNSIYDANPTDVNPILLL